LSRLSLDFSRRSRQGSAGGSTRALFGLQRSNNNSGADWCEHTGDTGTSRRDPAGCASSGSRAGANPTECTAASAAAKEYGVVGCAAATRRGDGAPNGVSNGDSSDSIRLGAGVCTARPITVHASRCTAVQPAGSFASAFPPGRTHRRNSERSAIRSTGATSRQSDPTFLAGITTGW
jgi:hypothetical protein